MKVSLKTQNIPLIGLYLIFNVAIFLTIFNTGNVDIENITLYFKALKIEDGIFFTMLSLIIIIVNGMFSNKMKEIIVFWKINNIDFNRYFYTKLFSVNTSGSFYKKL